MLSTVDKIEAILSLQDGSPELDGEMNEWADVARIRLIQKILDNRAADIKEKNDNTWIRDIEPRRKELGISRSELARRVGVHHEFIRLLEVGKRGTVDPVRTRLRQELKL
jgi:DNA-binding XRE family transcriptional regulator